MAHIAAARIAALAFLKEHKTGMLATATKEGRPQASTVFFVSDDKFSIYFITLLNSRKYASMQENPWAAFTIGTEAMPQTLQIEGMVTELRADEEKEQHIPNLLKVLTSNQHYYAPIAQLDTDDVAIMWLRPKWIRWGDYTSPQSGTKNVLTEIPVE